MPVAQGPLHVVPKSQPTGDVKSAADLGRAVAYQRTIAQSQVKDTKGNAQFAPAKRIAANQQREHQHLVNLARRVLAIHQASAINPTHDVKSDLERVTADAFKLTPQYEHDLTASALAHAEYQRQQDELAQKREADKYRGSVPKLGLGLITGHGPILEAANKLADKAASLGVSAVKHGLLDTLPAIGLARHIPGAEHTVEKTVGNAARELIDIPANAIPSLYYLASPLAKGHFETTAKRVIDPYIQAIEHPGKAMTEHPLTTALMFTGVGRGISRVAGRIDRAIPRTETVTRTVPANPNLGSKADFIKKNANVGVTDEPRLAEMTYNIPDKGKPGTALEQQYYRMKGSDIKPGEKVLGKPLPFSDKLIIHRDINGNPVGALHIVTDHKGKPEAVEVAVSPEHRGHGVATKMVQHAVDNGIDLKSIFQEGGLTKAGAGLSYNLLKNEKQTITQQVKKSGDYKLLERKLPGTAAKELIMPNKGYIGYRLQLRNELRAAAKQVARAGVNRYSHPFQYRQAVKDQLARMPTPRMSDTAIKYRTDQLFYKEQILSRQAAQDAAKEARAQGLPEEQIKTVSQEVHQMTQNYYRDASLMDMSLRKSGGRGEIRQFKNAEEAQKYADAWRSRQFNLGNIDVPKFVPTRLNDPLDKGPFILTPEPVVNQLSQHDSYLQPTTLTQLGTMAGGAFRRTVLPFSLKWFNSNVFEGALRSAVSGGALPTSIKAGIDFEKYLKENNPEYYAQWKTLVAGGGHGQMQRNLLVESNANTLGARFAQTKLADVAKALTEFGQKPGVKASANLFDKYTDLVFHTLNGNMERGIHIGMAGKLLRDHPLMSKELRDVTQRAMQEVERGGTADTHFMNLIIPMGRELHKMFGKYGGFSPGTRRLIATWTPFIAWSLNAMRFVLTYLPKDHPLATALLADANQASAGWRQSHGLSEFMSGAVPWWLMGSLPEGNAKLRVSQMTPFGAWSDPTQILTGTFNPLGDSVMQNLQGKDWRGKDLPANVKNNPYLKIGTALATFVEGTVPITGIAAQLAKGKSVSQIENPYRAIPPQKSSKSTNPFGSSKSSGGKNPFATSKKSNSSNPFK